MHQPGFPLVHGPERLGGTVKAEGVSAQLRQEATTLLTELPLAELSTHVFAFGDAAEAFRAVDEGVPGLMHAVLDYDRRVAGDL